MPHRIDTSTIKRIEVYRSVIESAPIVPATSQDVLIKAVSSMKLELHDLDIKAKNLAILVGLINLLVICFCVFIGSVLLMIIPPFLTAFILAINQVREEVTAFSLPTQELTEGCDNVPPIAPTTGIYWL